MVTPSVLKREGILHPSEFLALILNLIRSVILRSNGALPNFSSCSTQEKTAMSFPQFSSMMNFLSLP
jgi:hypothetical protein